MVGEVAITVTLLAVALFAVFLVRVIGIYRERERAWGKLDSDGVEAGLTMLLKRGYDGAVAVFSDCESGLFLQFRKYIAAPGQVGLEMHFPQASWSKPYYSGVQDVLRRHEVAFKRVGLDSESTTEAIYVDFGRDTSLATRVVSDILLDAFKAGAVRVRMQAEDLNPTDEVIEDSNHPRPLELLVGPRRVRR